MPVPLVEQRLDQIFDGRIRRAQLRPECRQRAAGSASKGALETLTRAWSAEFGPAGVRVNAISPGVVHGVTLDLGGGRIGIAVIAG